MSDSTPATPNIAANTSKDFRRLRREGLRGGASLAIGRRFCAARDALALGLIRIGATPNMLTTAGAAATFGAAWFFLIGAGERWSDPRPQGDWPAPLWAAILLFVASACDMLDGAVARIGAKSTPLGAVLDSSLDRVSDMALFAAMAAHFAWKGNVTYTALAAAALANATLISYLKARAENLIDDCSVGYWLRGERCAALLIAAFSAHLPAVLWQQAILPAFTALRRMVWTYRCLSAKQRGTAPPDPAPLPGARRYLAPWRFPRGSVPYDVVTGANIAYILFAPLISPLFGPAADPLRTILVAITGIS